MYISVYYIRISKKSTGKLMKLFACSMKGEAGINVLAHASQVLLFTKGLQRHHLVGSRPGGRQSRGRAPVSAGGQVLFPLCK